MNKILKRSIFTLIVIGVIVLFANHSCSSTLYSAGDIKMEKINKSKHYKENKFLNYGPSMDMNFIKMIPMMWDFLFTDNDRKPDAELPTQIIDFNQIINAKPDELKVTWVGHSSQIINIDGKIILTDPVYNNRTVFMGP